ncbi:MAG: hypothetical protein ACREQZ_13950 [Woeseiaceae bacterium]
MHWQKGKLSRSKRSKSGVLPVHCRTMEPSSQALWTFAKHLDVARTTHLLALAEFEEIVRLLETARITNFVWEAFASDHLRGCHRAAFLLETSPSTYDAFFNAPIGYRGQYARSIAAGLAANRLLLDALESTLIGFAWFRKAPNLQAIERSLRGADAKIWIDEVEVESHMGLDLIEILYPPWQQHSVSGVGLLAPVGTRLEVKGAWLDKNQSERQDPLKRYRASDIHLTGYS